VRFVLTPGVHDGPGNRGIYYPSDDTATNNDE
jgi:hypothetical protein